MSLEVKTQIPDRIQVELLWFPIAEDHKGFEEVFGEYRLGGHLYPTHGHLLGYHYSKSRENEFYGPPRDVKIFGTDHSDGVREDNLHGLLDCLFNDDQAQVKKAVKKARIW